jgi:hypothetical protein
MNVQAIANQCRRGGAQDFRGWVKILHQTCKRTLDQLADYRAKVKAMLTHEGDIGQTGMAM